MFLLTVMETEDLQLTVQVKDEITYNFSILLS